MGDRLLNVSTTPQPGGYRIGRASLSRVAGCLILVGYAECQRHQTKGTNSVLVIFELVPTTNLPYSGDAFGIQLVTQESPRLF